MRVLDAGMTVSGLSADPPHRVRHPVMRQTWRDLAYLHWPVAPGVVEAQLPAGLTVDTFEGTAWVALVPFEMVGIAIGPGPAIPYFGTFPETNVRTYVRGPDGPGIWFHSLDIDRFVPAMLARGTYRIPYAFARMSIRRSGDRIRYAARRRWPEPRGARSLVEIRVGPADPRPGRLETWLSARWRLYSVIAGHLAVARVEHPALPIHRAEVVDLADELVAAAGYPVPTGRPHTMFSPGASVRIGLPRLVG